MYEPAADPLPASLKVYETLYDKYDALALDVHHGVSTLLLDYLVLTCLLLVTDARDWQRVKATEEPELQRCRSIPTGFGALGSGSELFSASDPQWRKILYGEPLFPKLSPRPGSPALSDNTCARRTNRNSRSSRGSNGIRIRPSSLSARSPSVISSGTESEDDDDFHFESPSLPVRKAISRPPSPLSGVGVLPNVNQRVGAISRIP